MAKKNDGHKTITQSFMSTFSHPTKDKDRFEKTKDLITKQQTMEKQFILKKVNSNNTINEVKEKPKASFNDVFESVAYRSKPGYNGHYSKINQDSFVIEKNFLNDKNNSVFCVFDGHGEGGHKVAQHLKNYLYSNILDSIRIQQSRSDFTVTNPEHIKAILKQTFTRTNDELNRKLGSITDLSGSTGILVLIMKELIFTANIGDSKAAI